MFDAALDGGARALGAGPPGIAEGASADLVSLDPSHPTLAGKARDAVLDAWIFAAGAHVDCVWTHGSKQVSGGRHLRRDETARRFAAVMKDLSAG